MKPNSITAEDWLARDLERAGEILADLEWSIKQPCPGCRWPIERCLCGKNPEPPRGPNPLGWKGVLWAFCALAFEAWVVVQAVQVIVWIARA